MAKDAAPSFQFYPHDFVADPAVRLMSPEARGGYIMLLCAAWWQPEPGVIPADLVARLSELSEDRWAVAGSDIERAFDTRSRPGFWIQRRMVAERKAQEMRRKNAAKGARATNAMRWGSVANESLRSESLTVSPSSSSSSSSSRKAKPSNVKTSCSERQNAVAPSRLSLPCTSGQWWTPDAETLAAWKDAFPGVPAEPALQRMKAWLLANPTRGKTLRGMSRFATAWLAREQDSGKQAASSTPTGEAAIAAFLAESDGSDATR